MPKGRNFKGQGGHEEMTGRFRNAENVNGFVNILL